MSGEELAERTRALFGRASDGSLAEALRQLEGRLLSAHERQVRTWISDELERRHPEATTALDAWTAARDPRTYTEVLLEATGL